MHAVPLNVYITELHYTIRNLRWDVKELNDIIRQCQATLQDCKKISEEAVGNYELTMDDSIRMFKRIARTANRDTGRLQDTRVGRVIDEQEKEIAELKRNLGDCQEHIKCQAQRRFSGADYVARQKLTEAIKDFLVELGGYPRVAFNGIPWPETDKLRKVLEEHGTK